HYAGSCRSTNTDAGTRNTSPPRQPRSDAGCIEKKTPLARRFEAEKPCERLLLFRRLSHRLGHFVIRLDVLQLRLQEKRLSLKLASRGQAGLRTKGTAFLELLRRDAMRFCPQR